MPTSKPNRIHRPNRIFFPNLIQFPNNIGFSPEAQDYFDRLDAVGARLPRYDRANAYLIDSSKAAGSPYWDTMGTLTPMVAKGYSGLLIPIRDGMDVGTGVNLSSGNYNAVTGYIGDGSTMYIDSNRNNNTDGQDDQAMGVWVSASSSADSIPIGAGAFNASGSSMLLQLVATNKFSTRSRNASRLEVDATSAQQVGYGAISRSSSANYTVRVNGATTTQTQVSQTPLDRNIFVFRANDDTTPAWSNARLAVYHTGPSLTLSVMDTILTEFMARVAAA